MKLTATARLDDFISNLNKQAINTENYPYRYDWKFGKFQKELRLGDSPEELEKLAKKDLPQVTKHFRSLRVYVIDTTTNNRVHIYENHYVAKTAAELLKTDYREKLATEYLYVAFQNLTIGLANNVLKQLKEQEDAVDQKKPSMEIVSD